jgi:ATP-binding cassette subfamily F protein 3
MGSVSLHNVSHQFGGQIVLSDITCDVRTGETVGLVGPNGAGKTTLLRIIAGMLVPETGRVTRSRDLRIGYLAQEPLLDLSRTLREEVATAFAHVHALEDELHTVSDAMAQTGDGDERRALMRAYDRLHAQIETAGGYRQSERIGEVLGGLGFSIDDLELPVRVLSGGQKCRAALAKLLLLDDDLLLLDEPTNHLDIDAVRFLERFLAGHRGGALIVSHDRYLLDRLAQRIIEVARTQVRAFSGNYSTYAESKERERLTLERQRDQDAAFIRKERGFIAQHLAGQRTREAKGRRKRLERRLAAGEFVLEAPGIPPALRLAFDDVESLGGTIIRADGLTKGFTNQPLFTDLTLSIDAGGSCGVTGPNGVGKTTLLRVLCGELPADAGECFIHPRARVGYFAQEAVSPRDAQTVVETVLHAHPGLGEQRCRDLLARFGFRGDAAFKTRAQLSGGEHSRLRLLLLLLEAPNVLLLDEPTNHLDADAREALEAALADYPGTVLAISHDRYFLDRLVDQLLVLRPGDHERHAGNYSSYIREFEARRSEFRSERKAAGARTDRRAPEKKPVTPERPTARYDALSNEEIEDLIVEREHLIAELNSRFSDAGTYRSAEAVQKLHAALAAEREALAVLEAAWEERADV